MKAIILGVCDYLKDWWHDAVTIRIWRWQEKKDTGWVLGRYVMWKEGNLWYYIRQRRIAKRVKKRRSNHARHHNVHK